jgi:NAD(P)-dependent dehydrogenase (short-subunit alcohol dehydrogenase family)
MTVATMGFSAASAAGVTAIGRCVARNSAVHFSPAIPTASSRFYSNNPNDEPPPHPRRPKTALVLGSSGCLGSTVVGTLSRTFGRGGISIIGSDCVRPDLEADADQQLLDAFLPLPNPSTDPSCGKMATELLLGLKELDDLSRSSGGGGSDADGGLKLDAIICASGGWEGDPPTVDVDALKSDLDPNDSLEERMLIADAMAHGDAAERMVRMNLYPILAAGRAMDRYMAPQGLFVAIGAAAALAPTPSMYAYGAAKAAVHHYVQTLGASSGPGTGVGHKAQRKKASIELRRDREYLDNLTALAVLPSVIDTPTNRRFAEPGADVDAWTKPEAIAEEIAKWLDRPYLRPNSGALIKVQSGKKGGDAVFNLVR